MSNKATRPIKLEVGFVDDGQTIALIWKVKEDVNVITIPDEYVLPMVKDLITALMQKQSKNA